MSRLREPSRKVSSAVPAEASAGSLAAGGPLTSSDWGSAVAASSSDLEGLGAIAEGVAVVEGTTAGDGLVATGVGGGGVGAAESGSVFASLAATDGAAGCALVVPMRAILPEKN